MQDSKFQVPGLDVNGQFNRIRVLLSISFSFLSVLSVVFFFFFQCILCSSFIDGIKYMIHDRGTNFSPLVRDTLKGLGIESVRTSYRSPWQNGVAERWAGSCRRELLNHVIVLNEKHLLKLLAEYVRYYNEDRTH